MIGVRQPVMTRRTVFRCAACAAMITVESEIGDPPLSVGDPSMPAGWAAVFYRSHRLDAVAHVIGCSIACARTAAERLGTIITSRVRIDYTNHRGERRWRLIVPTRIDFRETPHHTPAQWVIDAFDVERHPLPAPRTFALAQIHAWEPVPD